MNAAEALKRWLGVTSEGASRLEAARNALARHREKPCTSADPADHRRWNLTECTLKEDVAAEEGALRIANEQKADAQRAADDAADRDKVENYLREKKGIRLEVLKVFDLSAEIAKRLPVIDAHVERGAEVAKIGARLGLPPVIDAERELREIPGREVPASIRKEMAWVDENGERPSQLQADSSGRLVPCGSNNHGQYQYKQVEVVQRRAETVPPRMPERLAQAIRLVGLKGEPLFPAR